MKRLLLLITFILSVLYTSGQTVYPIRTYTVLNPPLPYTLSGFASEPGRMQLNVVVDDVSLDQYAVKFRITIQGNGIKLYTKPDLRQQPFFLDGGLTETVTGLDLEPLFNPDNLIFEGYSRNEYKRNGRLPEGVYRVWVDILDYYRSFQVSQSIPGIAMIYLTRAPRLSFPMSGSEIDPRTEPNLRFSWMGTLPADPLADIAYRFRLWEIRPQGRDPYEVARAMQPIFTEETTDPNFIYDMGLPPLIDGMNYAWQVEAIDREGRARFQNDGTSEVYTFRYGRSCITPEPVITSVGQTEVALRWSGDLSAQLYRISYKGSDESEWQHLETASITHTLKELKDNAGYEIKVQAICNDQEGDYSRIVRFKTNRIVDYTCGAAGDEFDLSNREPLASLGRFDEFKAADFVIEVEEAQGANGLFSGKGLALVPYLGFVKFMVTFENVFINTDRRMVDGQVQFVYDETTGMVFGFGMGGGEDADEAIDIVEEVAKVTDKVITTDGEVSDVTVSGNTVTITKKDGSTETVTVADGKKVAIVSPGGSGGGAVHVVDQASGRVFTTPKKKAGGKNGSSSVGTAATTGQYGCAIDFKPASTMRFGYDPVGDGKSKPDAYFNRNKSGDLIPWKSIQSGSTDFIDVVIKGDCHPDSLRYLRESGLITPSVPQDKGSRLMIIGLADGEEDILTVAVAKTEHINDSTTREILTEAGALGLVAYDAISKNVVLVPINDAQCPTNPGIIKTELDKLFGPAVTSWQVTIRSNLNVEDLAPEGFKTSGNSFAARYTNDMKTVINKLKRQSDYDRKTLYLFFVNAPKADRAGYMPLAGDFGFIFNFGSNTNVIGHELAHGTFNLRHTFSDQAQHYLPEKSTKNLMDYANGTELWKYQWDLIHNPEMILFDAFDEEEGAAFRENGTDLQTICDESVLEIINRSKIFYTPDLQKIDLDKINGASANRFYTINDVTVDARGTVNGFVKDDKQYVMVYGASSKRVKKFKHKVDDEILIDQLLYEGNAEPQLVYIDCINSNVWLSNNETKYDFECVECETSDIPCADLLNKYKDSPIMQSHILRTAILKDPCILENPFVPNGEGLGYETEFMKGLNTMVGAGLAAAFAPVVIEFILVPSLEAALPQLTNVAAGVTTEELSRRGVQAAIGVTVDATMQAAFAYYFDLEDDQRTWENAIRTIDPWQAGASGVEAAFDKAWLEIVSSCILDASFNNGEFKGNFDSYECLKGALSAAITNGAFKGAGIAFKKLKALAKTNPIKFKQGLERLGISKDKIEEVKDKLLRSTVSATNAINLTDFNINLSNPGLYRKVKNVLSSFEFKAKDNVLDIIIHGDGTKFINDGVEISADDLTKLIPEGTKAVRLLSCNNTEAAKNLAQKLNVKVIANDGITRIHKDGGISSVARNGNSKASWFAFDPDGTSQTFDLDVKTSYADDYIELGASPKVVGEILESLHDFPAVKKLVNNGDITEEAAQNLAKTIRNEYPELITKIDNQLGELLVKAGSGNTQILAQISNWEDNLLSALSKDLGDNASFAREFFEKVPTKPDLVESWKIISNKPQLRKDIPTLESVTNIRSNPHISEFGIDNDLLKSIKGWGNSGVQVGYKEIVDQMGEFVSFVKNNSINCIDCDKFMSIFKTNSNNDKQAIYWILEDVVGDVGTFGNKTLRREIQVTKVDGSSGFIDVVVKNSNADDLLIEYKWYAGSNIISQKLFESEFIKRDLFSISKLNQIQWRIKGRKLDKSTVHAYLNSSKSELEKVLDLDKVKGFFSSQQGLINDDNYVEFFISKMNTDEVFNKIFK